MCAVARLVEAVASISTPVTQCFGMVLRNTGTVNIPGGTTRQWAIAEYITFAIIGSNNVLLLLLLAWLNL